MIPPENALVRCDCGWWVPEDIRPGVSVAVTLAPHVQDMVRHWQDGHRLSCQSSLRYQVRDLLKRYRQLQRALQRAHQRGEDIADMPRRRRGSGAQPLDDPWD